MKYTAMILSLCATLFVACSGQNVGQSAVPSVALLKHPSIKSSGSPWVQFPLKYTAQNLFAATLSASNSVWFADTQANLIGKVTGGGTTTPYTAGDFVYQGPSGPVSLPANPTDVEAGPNSTTYYASVYGYGIMAANGTKTTNPIACDYSPKCNNPGAIQLMAAYSMAATSDGSAWLSASLVPPPSNPHSPPVIIRALGQTPTIIPVPTAPPPDSAYPPQDLALGPDGNLWYTDLDVFGTVNATSNTVTTYSIPSTYAGGTLGDIAPGPDGALWMSDCGTPYLLRTSLTGLVTGYLVPINADCFPNPHQIAAGPNNTLYLGGASGYQILRLNITSKQFSTYNVLPKPTGGGVETLTLGADRNVWVFQQSNSHIGHVFISSYTIATKPASLQLKAGTSATITVSEGHYTGNFRNTTPGSTCASVTPSESSGQFTVTAVSGPTSPCFASFADELGNGAVYVELTVKP